MPGVGPAQMGYRGRQSSIHRTPVLPGTDLAGEPTILLVAFHEEEYMVPGLYPATAVYTYDTGDLSFAGGQPYADTISDVTVEPWAENYVAGQRWAILTEGLVGDPDFGLNWYTGFGWPTPPHGGLTDTFYVAYAITGFTAADLSGLGLEPRMHASAGVFTIGTSEATTTVDAPAVTWTPEDDVLSDCLVLRGCFVQRDGESTSNGTGALSAIQVLWSNYTTTGTHPTKTIIETPVDPDIGDIDTDWTSATIDGATGVPSFPSYYTSSQTSETVMVWTVVLGAALPAAPPVDPETNGARGDNGFRFTQTWATMGPLLLTEPDVAADLLERHDQELEEDFVDHGCGEFLYTFRWPTFHREFLNGDPRAVDVLERRDQELEDASEHQGEGEGQTNDGSCRIMLTHRWREIADLVASRDARAWDLLDMRDREIEEGRNLCGCGEGSGGPPEEL